MKPILFIAAIALNGCAYSRTDTKWNEMLTDIYLTHQMARYDCPNCHPPRSGYSKENASMPEGMAPTKVIIPKMKAQEKPAVVALPEDKARNLEARISALEETISHDLPNVNQNEQEIAAQIRALQSQMPKAPIATELPTQ
jgi:hypothetical protein